MKMKYRRILYALGFIWVSPITILAWILFCLPAWALGQTYRPRVDPYDLIFYWPFRERSWLCRFCDRKGWAGVTLGANIIDAWLGMDGLDHEEAHVFQQYRWGCSFYLIYILECIYLYVFTVKNPYADNHFERAARKAAGQADPEMEDRIPW